LGSKVSGCVEVGSHVQTYA
jgi:hypothetical protein